MPEYFSSNMDILFRKDMVLARSIRDTEPDGSFEILRTESGYSTVRQHLNGGSHRFIHSRVDPGREAETWLSYQKVDKNHAVILGIGLTYHVAELLNTFPECKRIFLIEADLQLFRLTMESEDLSNILSNTKVHLYAGQDLQAFKQTVPKVLSESFSYHSFLPAMSLHPEFYNPIIRILDRHLYKTRLHGGGNCKDILPPAGGVRILLHEMRN